MLYRWAVLVTLLTTALHAAEGPAPAPAPAAAPAASAGTTPPGPYGWKPGDVYRFDYFKSITLAPDLKDPNDQRKTDVAGILIFEVASDGKATMRFDSPRVTLPDIITFSSQVDEPEVQKDKTRVVAKSIEGALKAARWDVQLGSDGTLHIRDRKPENFLEWAKDVETTAGWRKKSFKSLTQLIDNDLGLKVQADDPDFFFCLTPSTPPPPSNAAAKAEAALRPVRTQAVPAATDGDKARYTFSRIAPAGAGQAYTIPDVFSTSPVTVKLNKVQAVEGTAVMDTRLSMLDTLSEEFVSEIVVAYGKDSVQRQVRVQYRIKRLAPPISKQ